MYATNVCVCVCVCVHACVRACVCVCALLYDSSSTEFVGHCPIEIKVTVGLLKLSPLPQYKLSGPITNFSHMIRKMK